MSKLTSMLFAALLWPCFAGAQVPASYHATALGSGTALAMNNQGQVVGLDAHDRPTIWSRTGVATALAGQVYQPYISGINDDGTVVGQGLLTDPDLGGYYQPLIWRPGASAERIDLPGLGGNTYGINQRGDIIGIVAMPGEPYTTMGFLKRDSGTVYFEHFYPTGINDAGHVVGSGANDIQLWRDGNFSQVGEQCCGFPGHINNQDWIIGTYDNFHTGLWRDGVFTETWEGYSRDINDAGMVVGSSSYASAVLWYEGEVYELDHLWHEPQWHDWLLTTAVAINERGEIAAEAKNIVSGEFMIVLLSPVPEPSHVALLLAGLLLLGGLHRAIARNAIATVRTI
jgi:hypothetical protein